MSPDARARGPIQQQIRKQVKIELYKSDLDLSDAERDELTTRVIQLARSHYE
ncbi:hypothetical protein [Natrinema sp. J7-2]|uniref:hypothetical protein n=1 Tax=Natrinema sp. (strain J7-2) TaxID=406552 RepID=UPI00026D4E82|nr:hypothetical protein [Natrinema sp. J7-2]AFO57285.1 type I site-specific deoxyribonuclease, HsdR family protein [Natrinema sp. J7-2]